MHRPMHPEISIIPANCPGRFSRIELHAVEPGPGDVLLRSIDADPIPILEGSVLEACAEQLGELFLGSLHTIK